MLSMATSGGPSKSEAEVESLMCERGKLLLSNDFDKPLGRAWKVAKGKCDVANGAIQGSEFKSHMHGAVIRANLPLHNAVIQYSFKLRGAKTISFSINDPRGLVCGLLQLAAISESSKRRPFSGMTQDQAHNLWLRGRSEGIQLRGFVS